MFAALLWWSWRKWPDPLIDFGRELYVPWQITRGRVLYRDLASLFGPLSPYLNALWFRLFGASILTLALCNLAILAAMLFGIYRLVRLSTDRATATAASLLTLLLFAFPQYLEVGNYNFVTPYAHEATHGLALSVAMMVALYEGIARNRRTLWALAGSCFGLVMLTKPEVAVATAAAVCAASIAVASMPGERRGLAGRLSLFAACAAIPAALFFLYFTARMPAADAARAVAGAWVPAFNHDVARSAFYLRVSGLDRPLWNALRMFTTFCSYLLFVAAGMLVSRPGAKGSRPVRLQRLQQIALLLIVAVVAMAGSLFYALPLIACVGLVIAAVSFREVRTERQQALRELPLVMLSAFALVLLAKIALNARIVHYGFYLALPAAIVMVVQLCWLFPRALDRRRGGGRTFRQLAVCALLLVAAPYLVLANHWYRSKVLPVAADGDRFYASAAPGAWQGAAMENARRELEQSTSSGATVAVMPEGVMLNYLLRRDSPLRVINLMPPEILIFGEDDVLRSLAAAPPDAIVLVQKDVREYGYPPFGTDARYGLKTMTWIREHYRLVSIVGSGERDGEPAAGLQILRRNF